MGKKLSKSAKSSPKGLTVATLHGGQGEKSQKLVIRGELPGSLHFFALPVHSCVPRAIYEMFDNRRVNRRENRIQHFSDS